MVLKARRRWVLLILVQPPILKLGLKPVIVLVMESGPGLSPFIRRRTPWVGRFTWRRRSSFPRVTFFPLRIQVIIRPKTCRKVPPRFPLLRGRTFRPRRTRRSILLFPGRLRQMIKAERRGRQKSSWRFCSFRFRRGRTRPWWLLMT